MISLGYGANPLFYHNDTFTHLVGIMVQFPYENEDDPLTSGRGHFISKTSISFIDDQGDRCDGFLADSPPHDSAYFTSQLIAVENYYTNVSGNGISFQIHLIDTVFTVSNPMRHYAKSDSTLGVFFSESLALAETDIETWLTETEVLAEETLFVVFHAGLGQDFSVPFIDPTSHDLKSAYVDNEILTGVEITKIDGVPIMRGLILPETQNMIYFDVVEDIFYGTEDLCDIQVGLTGTFSFLLGYEFGLPPLFNTETGQAGVGIFGFMDHGSNNGRGVIPAPPTAWTRLFNGWANETVITETGEYTIKPRNQHEDIYRINISSDEYFLIENRNNRIAGNVDIDSLRREFRISDTQLGHWFDTVIDHIPENEYSVTNGVFTQFENYDIGLPGSGLLIWHIKEPDVDAILGGINNDRENRSVQLEEADGAVDIGYSSAHPLFTQHVHGWQYDLWYADNHYYFNYGNPALEEDNDNRILYFDDQTRPSTKTSESANSNISIKVLSESGSTMTFSVEFGASAEMGHELLSENEITILGNGVIDEMGTIFYADGDSIYQATQDTTFTIKEVTIGDVVLVEGSEITIANKNSFTFVYLKEDGSIDRTNNYFAKGYLSDTNIPETEMIKYSLGDLDGDGLDELVKVIDGNIEVTNYLNETPVNGFPVFGNFYDQPLIVDMDDNEDGPEIICREGKHITILSSGGDRLNEIAALYPAQQIAVVPSWQDSLAAIIDGAQLLLTEINMDNSYWLNEYSRSSNYPQSTGVHKTSGDFKRTSELNAYNYPNPIQSGKTTFRFFIDDAESVTINIYDVLGHKIIHFEENILIHNEYNEVQWSVEPTTQPGLYYAEVVTNTGESDLVKLVVIQ